MPKSSFSSCESGIGQEESLDSHRKHFFMNFVPQLESLYRRPGDPVDDPLETSMDNEADEILSKPISHKEQQSRPKSLLVNRPKMIMAGSSNCSSREDSSRTTKMILAKSNASGNMIDSPKADSSMDEISLIVGHLKSGGPYCEKLVNIMLKGMEKSWPGLYKIFRETGVPDNFCPIVKMNNDNTPYVEFLIKADTADQDPFSQLNGYTTEYMALCKFVVNRLFQEAPQRQSDMAPPPAKRSPMLQQNLQQQKQSQQQQFKQQQSQQQQYRLQQQPKSKVNMDQTFGVPLACSTPKSQRHRVLPPRACKYMNRSDL